MEMIQINGVSYIKADDVFKAAKRDVNPYPLWADSMIRNTLNSYQRLPENKKREFDMFVHYLQYAGSKPDACFAEGYLRNMFAFLMGDCTRDKKGHFVYSDRVETLEYKGAK